MGGDSGMRRGGTTVEAEARRRKEKRQPQSSATLPLFGELWDLLEQAGVVTLGGETLENARVGLRIEGGLAAEHPGEFAVGVANDTPLVVFVEIDDQVRHAQGPDELDTPLSVGGFICDPRDTVPSLERGVEAAFAEEEDVVDLAVGAQRIAVKCADFAFFEGVGDVRKNIPVAHVAGEIDMWNRFEGWESGGVFHGGAGAEGRQGEQGGEEAMGFHTRRYASQKDGG